MDLNHLHIGVRDVKRSQAFYVSYFGFAHSADHGEGVFLRNADGFLMSLEPVEEIPTLPTWFHVGFCLPSADLVTALHDRMRLDDVSMPRALIDIKGEAAAYYCVDPDGYRIEVSWHAD